MKKPDMNRHHMKRSQKKNMRKLLKESHRFRGLLSMKRVDPELNSVPMIHVRYRREYEFQPFNGSTSR